MKHLYIFFCIIFTLASQLIVKSRMVTFGALPEGHVAKIIFLVSALFDPAIIVALIFTLLAGLSWMAAMTHFQLNYAYPYIALLFPLILIFSSIIFKEPVNIEKIVGVAVIMLGIIISSRG